MNSATFVSALTVTVAFAVVPVCGELWAGENAALPQAVTDEHFHAFLDRSPFTRSLNLSDTLVLTGMAQMDGKPVATILDTEVGLSVAVSDSPNDRGWKMIELARADDLEFAVASISVESGEVFRVRYDKERIKNTNQRLGFAAHARAQRAAAEARAHSGGGGGHGVPQERVNALRQIDRNELPKGYNPGAGRNKEESHQLHQNYVDNRMAGMSERQRGMVGQMWKQKEAVEPGMPNRGAAFVKIMEHVAENESR